MGLFQLKKAFPVGAILETTGKAKTSNYNDISKLKKVKVIGHKHPDAWGPPALQVEILEGEVFHKSVEYSTTNSNLDGSSGYNAPGNSKRNWRNTGKKRRSYPGDKVHFTNPSKAFKKSVWEGDMYTIY